MRTWMASVFGVGLAVLIGLLLVEVVLRAFLPVHFASSYVDAFVYDDELGFRLKSDASYRESTDYLQEVRTNPLGTVNYQDSFAGYERLVFALGDSYTQGTGVSTDASYPFQLDLILNREDGRYRKRFGVVNLGLSSFGMKQSLLVLERYRELLGDPDVVLFLGTHNDHADDQSFDSGAAHRVLVEGSPRFGVWERPIGWLAYRTEIGKRIKLVLSASRRGDAAETRQAYKQQNVAELQEPLFEELQRRCERMGARLVVSWTDLPDATSPSYDWLRSWAARRGVEFADWHARVEDVRIAMPALPIENPHSGRHFRPWVNRMIAESFAARIDR